MTADLKRGRALLIATATYRDASLSRLPSTRVDARGLSEVLRDPAIGNFQVTEHLDLPCQEWRVRIADFFSGRSRDELLLLYISGHGVKDDKGRLYFAATDTDASRLLATGVPASFIHEAASPSRRRPVVMILDTCFSGAYSRELLKAPQTVNFSDYYGDSTGTAVITASGAIEHALAGDAAGVAAQPSLFTRHLIGGLRSGEADRDGDGQVSLDDLFKHVSIEVQNETRSQRPERFYFGLDGDLIIASNPKPRPGRLPQELSEYIQDPRPKVKLLAVGELGRLLTEPSAPLALAARQALEQLVRDDSRMVADAAAAALARKGAAAERADGAQQQRQADDRGHEQQGPAPVPSRPIPAPRWQQRTVLGTAVALVALIVGIYGWLERPPVATPSPSGPPPATSGAPILAPQTDAAERIVQQARSSSASEVRGSSAPKTRRVVGVALDGPGAAMALAPLPQATHPAGTADTPAMGGSVARGAAGTPETKDWNSGWFLQFHADSAALACQRAGEPELEGAVALECSGFYAGGPPAFLIRLGPVKDHAGLDVVRTRYLARGVFSTRLNHEDCFKPVRRVACPTPAP